MKIADHIYDLLGVFDLETARCEPECLSDIVSLVRSRRELISITMFARNNEDSANYLYNICEDLIDKSTEESDVMLAALLVVISELDDDRYTDLMSRASKELRRYRWSASMAASYLLSKEVKNATVRISA